MKYSSLFIAIFLAFVLPGQAQTDPWISSQLKQADWQRIYKGVLADFHPVTITLATDHEMIAGILQHDGDTRRHTLLGEWKADNLFELQERDENDRLTGYLSGSITEDQLQMEWMSADQSRAFQVKAFPQSLIKIKNFKPIEEWIEVGTEPKWKMSVQKLDYGIVNGIASHGRRFVRFEGYCLDGSCSLWNTVIQNPNGAPIRVQMRQKDSQNYKANFDGVDYPAAITSITPLVIRKFDNSTGFLDFVYPDLPGQNFKAWLSHWLDPVWTEGTAYLNQINQPGQGGRLINRSTGWLEIVEDDPGYVSGLITYINPGSIKRIPFVWLKKEDELLTMEELVNAVADKEKASAWAVADCAKTEDVPFRTWLQKTGYPYLLPVKGGLAMTTVFDLVYGDDIRLMPVEESKAIVKRKYWKYFGW